MRRKNIFREAFVANVHTLVQLGFEQLNDAALSGSEEPAITGDLVHAMRAVCEAPNAEDWMTMLSVHDDPPIEGENRRGKARRRVDVEVEHVGRGPRPRFRWEAKRLGHGYGVGRYVGEEGMGCFVSRRYGAQLCNAGMLGYVQSDDVDAWLKKIGQGLMKKKKALRLILQEGHPWQSSGLLPTGYQSVHDVDDGLMIYHVLLDFRAGGSFRRS